MDARFVHRFHDVIHVELRRFLTRWKVLERLTLANEPLLPRGPCGFQLLDDPVHTETARLLPWREVQKRLHELRCDHSCGANAEHAFCCPPTVADRFMHTALEGVGTEVYQRGPRLGGIGVLPDIEPMRFLDHEVHFVVLVSHCGQFADIGEIEDFLARAVTLATLLEVVEHVVPVQVDLEGLVPAFVALQQLLS